jgi:hypothetical protein
MSDGVSHGLFVVGASVTALMLSIIDEMRLMLPAGTAEGGIR